jgi:glyoxylase-like metal-dependent hydrolase (beta-lactamase superfamily II)
MVDYEVIVKGNSLRLAEGFLALANATLVFTPDGPVLFDVGHHVNRLALLNGLARHDLAPGDVCAVFLSHLHFDHCNNIDLFPAARVYVSSREWEYAKRPHEHDMFVPWLIHEQLGKHEVEFLDGEGRIADGVRYMPTPGHTPGSYALVLDTEKHGCVVVAGDAIKYVKELIAGRCDMAFDTPEAGADSIARITQMADRIVPGHFPELIRDGEKFVWDEAMEFSLLMR